MIPLIPFWTEFIPVVAAVITAIFASRAIMKTQGLKRIPHVLTLIASMMLAFLQLKWYQTFHIEGNILDTIAVNAGWTCFNLLVMLAGSFNAYIESKHETNV